MYYSKNTPSLLASIASMRLFLLTFHILLRDRDLAYNTFVPFNFIQNKYCKICVEVNFKFAKILGSFSYTVTSQKICSDLRFDWSFIFRVRIAKNVLICKPDPKNNEYKIWFNIFNILCNPDPKNKRPIKSHV